MKKIHVDLGKRSYDILIGAGLLDQLPSHLQEYNVSRRLFIVSNMETFELHGRNLLPSLEEVGFEVTEIFIPDGEKYKNLHTVENIYTYLMAQRADRGSTIAALGGGVTGDIVGFAAATYMRGIAYLQLPTTLLAQVDSSVGGKTGVNHPQGKNLIGAFHQPGLVCADIKTLSSLPRREFRSGLYEVIKYGLIYDLSFFEFIEDHLDSIEERGEDVLEQIVARCCEIKAEVTSHDEREAGLRRILNFGHTFGHAIEVLSGYHGLTHGAAVAWGMLVAARLSQQIGLLDVAFVERISRLIRRVGPLPPVAHFDVEDLIGVMDRDKKRREDSKFLVLLTGIGSTEIRGDLQESQMIAAWNQVMSEDFS